MSSEDEIVTFRLAPRDRVAIKRLVERGEFRNRSDFLRYAVKTTLEGYGGSAAARLDLELEGVELSAPPAPARRGSGRRDQKGVNHL